MNKRSYCPFLVHCYYGKPGAGKSYYEMQQELKRLKESEKYYRKGFAELHERIDRVIEYLNKNSGIDDNWIAVSKRDLLKMLKGEDE